MFESQSQSQSQVLSLDPASTRERRFEVGHLLLRQAPLLAPGPGPGPLALHRCAPLETSTSLFTVL